MIIHSVLMRFDDLADADETARLMRVAADQVDVIRRFAMGRNLSAGPAAYDLGLLIELDSLDDVQTYLDHPAHQAAAEFARPRRSHVAICDFSA